MSPAANNLPGATVPFRPQDHMMKLSGKDYLPVAARLAWINAEFGHEFSLETECTLEREWQEPDPKAKPGSGLTRTVREARFRATITFPNGTRKSASGSEKSTDFADYAEKAETKSVGRALGYAGYGTLQAPEFDETATIARSEARNKAQENTYENTRAVDTAQDLSRIRKAEAPVEAPKEAPSAPAAPVPAPAPTPVTTGPSSTTSNPSEAPSSPAPAPVAAPVAASELADMGTDQLKQRLLQLMSQAKGKDPLQQQVNETISGASQAGGVKKAGDLPVEKLRALVQAVAEMVVAGLPIAA